MIFLPVAAYYTIYRSWCTQLFILAYDSSGRVLCYHEPAVHARIRSKEWRQFFQLIGDLAGVRYA